MWTEATDASAEIIKTENTEHDAAPPSDDDEFLEAIDVDKVDVVKPDESVMVTLADIFRVAEAGAPLLLSSGPLVQFAITAIEYMKQARQHQKILKNAGKPGGFRRDNWFRLEGNQHC
jgi:hypothetical protein